MHSIYCSIWCSIRCSIRVPVEDVSQFAQGGGELHLSELLVHRTHTHLIRLDATLGHHAGEVA